MRDTPGRARLVPMKLVTTRQRDFPRWLELNTSLEAMLEKREPSWGGSNSVAGTPSLPRWGDTVRVGVLWSWRLSFGEDSEHGGPGHRQQRAQVRISQWNTILA